MENTMEIVITGEHNHKNFPTRVSDHALKWIQLPVLRFERLPIEKDFLQDCVDHPKSWVVFSSSRAVKYFKEVFVENGLNYPTTTSAVCIGAQTADEANKQGFSVCFYPSCPGSEVFLKEFKSELEKYPSKRTVLLPRAEQGRVMVKNKLEEWGCEVEDVIIYRSLPRKDLEKFISQAQLQRLALILFTSPSSVDAFLNVFTLPQHIKIGSIGHFTGKHLIKRGFINQQTLPGGDFQKIGELL